MSLVPAVAGPLPGVVALLAAAAAAVALVAGGPRRRAAAVLAALGLAVAALAVLEGAALLDGLTGRPASALAGALAGAAVVGALAALLRRRPAALAPLVFVALPFRVPVPLGEETASLLVPLYAVIAAGAIAYALRRLGGAARRTPPEHRATGRLRLALAVVLVLYAAQSLYSTDVAQAVENLAFFYLPFAVLFVLLAELEWTQRLLRQVLAIAVGLALVFAVIGFFEYATGELLIANAKVREANELKPYFRVNSLFFDPNIYGRFLALTMVALAAALVWTRSGRWVALIAAALVALWAGLVLSLSQSSFAALLAGLAVLAALRWGVRPVLAAVGGAAVVAVALVVLAPGAFGLVAPSERALDRATSGRLDLVRGGAEMVVDRPLWGFGSGAFAERYRARERVRSERAAAASHTIPLTVAAEQGVVGLAVYLALLAAALALLFGGVGAALRSAHPALPAVARAAVAAVFAALVLHTLVYAAFLEDPAAWVLLAVGAALRPPSRRAAGERARRPEAPPAAVATVDAQPVEARA